MRNWLLYANPLLVEPQQDDEAREDVLRARLRQQVERYALALADAVYGKDIVDVVREYEEARDDG